MQRHSGRTGTVRAVAIPSVVLAWVLLLPAGLSSPLPHPTAATTASAWAYAGNRSFNGTFAVRDGVVSVSERFAFEVSLNQTAGPNGTWVLETTRAMGGILLVSFCSPDCANPTVTLHVTYHAFEVVRAFANVTTNGTVRVNGTDVPAVAVLGVDASVRGGMFDNDSMRGVGAMQARGYDASLSVTLQADSHVGFSGGLGLLPLAPTPGESWSSQSHYAATGSWSAQFSLVRTALLAGASLTRSGAPGGSLSAQGVAVVNGTDLGGLTLRDGSRVDQFALALTGGLRLREGFLFLPASTDLFGGSVRPDLPNGNGTVGASLSSVDFAPSFAGHVGFLASAAAYSASSSTSSTGAPAGPSPMATPSGPVIVQAQPESPSAVSPGCTVTASCGGSASPGAGPSLRPLVLALAVGAVGVIAVLATVAVARRPRLAPRPNEALYPLVAPPPAAASPRPRAGPGPSAPSDGAEPDPLSHLW